MSKRRGRTPRADGLATRSRILKAATSMFSASGYEATSLRQIAGAADIDLATLKYHFGDKPTLFAEVYRAGHEAFVAWFRPLLSSMHALTTRDEVRENIRALVASMHSYVEKHLPFVRLVLYRILEDSSDIIGLEEELQGSAAQMLEDSFHGMCERGLTRPIDARAWITFLTTSFSIWHATCRVKPGWVGEPVPTTPEGRERSEAFFRNLLESMLLMPEG